MQRGKHIATVVAIFLAVSGFFFIGVAVAAKQPSSGEGGNASNPLAKVKNTDLRWHRLDLDGGAERDAYRLSGSFMVTSKLKISYEAHYWDTDITGQSIDGWESFHLKGIYFPKQGEWNHIPYRLAVGLEWILDGNNEDKGIGSGSDQIAPFVGAALSVRKGTVLIPLVQHFVEYNGNDVNKTSLRLIGIQTLPKQWWGKLDAKVPFDWENDTVPATVELQIGKMFSRGFGVYMDGLIGIGNDRPYDYGVGVGLRLVY